MHARRGKQNYFKLNASSLMLQKKTALCDTYSLYNDILLYNYFTEKFFYFFKSDIDTLPSISNITYNGITRVSKTDTPRNNSRMLCDFDNTAVFFGDIIDSAGVRYAGVLEPH